MNLELLDPFQRPIPDRIDATLGHAKSAHPSILHGLPLDTSSDHNIRNSSGDEITANICRFHRRGQYLAVGYGSGTLAIYSLLSRSLVGLYPPVEHQQQHVPPQSSTTKGEGHDYEDHHHHASTSSSNTTATTTTETKHRSVYPTEEAPTSSTRTTNS